MSECNGIAMCDSRWRYSSCGQRGCAGNWARHFSCLWAGAVAQEYGVLSHLHVVVEIESEGSAFRSCKVASEVWSVNFAKMSRLLLITDSNFINNIGDFKGRKIKDLEVKSCQSRRAVMHEAYALEEGIVVFSCLDMLAADIVKSTANEAQAAIEHHLNQLFYTLAGKVEEADGKLAVGVMAPLFWSSLSEETRRTMNHAYKTMKKASVKGIWISGYFGGIQVGADGTHLTRLSANKFIQHTFDFFSLIGMASNLGRPVFDAEGEGSTTGPSDWTEEVAERDPDAVTLLNKGK